jgi:hypothetical protein
MDEAHGGLAMTKADKALVLLLRIVGLRMEANE